jgi:hypothetical protein
MPTQAERLKQILEDAYPRLNSMNEARASEKPYPAKWSIKEILGHLIDSTANNHQRIVRMQESPDIGAFGYKQENWVRLQKYQEESWLNLVELWYRYNLHLAYAIAQIAPSSLTHMCDIGKPKPVTLQFIVEDYMVHLEHHIEQIFSESDPRDRKPRA